MFQKMWPMPGLIEHGAATCDIYVLEENIKYQGRKTRSSKNQVFVLINVSCTHSTQCIQCMQCVHCVHSHQVYHADNVYSFGGMAGSTAMACIHCKKMQAVVEMTQDRNKKWVCWHCSYPACSGCGERCPAAIIWNLLTSSL